ncbi:unnamed protein product [Urochloa humidicola]
MHIGNVMPLETICYSNDLLPLLIGQSVISVLLIVLRWTDERDAREWRPVWCYLLGRAAANNGMLQFYLTPMRSGSSRPRSGGGLPSKAGPKRPLATQSFAHSMLPLY